MEGHEAMFWEKDGDDRVRCLLCPHNCVIAPGRTGRCGVRKNEGGGLVSLSYGQTVTAVIDPVEKKPLYHFMPGSRILSIGPNGCTLTCDHCQNWQISQEKAPTQYIGVDDLVMMAGRDGSIGVAFTYTEPLIWYEYIMNAAPRLREAGLKSVLVTNGFLEPDPAREIVSEVDAFNVDLKSFDEAFYRDHCGGSIEPVKEFIEIAAPRTHVEVTCLVIPGKNDGVDQIERMARWLAGISREIPLHLSRFFPHFRMQDVPPTPAETLQAAYEKAREYLDYVYIGNIFIRGTEDTRCPKCGTPVIERSGFTVGRRDEGGKCPECGRSIKGVWS